MGDLLECFVSPDMLYHLTVIQENCCSILYTCPLEIGNRSPILWEIMCISKSAECWVSWTCQVIGFFYSFIPKFENLMRPKLVHYASNIQVSFVTNHWFFSLNNACLVLISVGTSGTRDWVSLWRKTRICNPNKSYIQPLPATSLASAPG